MSKTYILLTMIFCHIVDDFYLQGWLANAKQKSWWRYNAPQKLYQYDYMWALTVHSFSWAFMIMLPLIVIAKVYAGALFTTVFIVNTILHAIVDDLKANKGYINLWVDQIIHIAQIIITFSIFIRW